MPPIKSPFRIEREDEIAIIVMDSPGESMNTLRASFADDFDEVFAHLMADEGTAGIVLISGKKDSFIAGANIEMLDHVRSAEEGAELSRQGQRALDRLAALAKPVVAAIDGVCLGGGLEVALACHARVASDSPKTKLGVPESQLGLLPGAGGTQRLPRLIGVQAALDLMLTGRQVRAASAKKMGLVDEVVPAPLLREVAIKHAKKLVKSQNKPTKQAKATKVDADALKELALAGNPLGRWLVFDQARKKLLEKTRGNYPAQEKILEVVEAGLAQGVKAGLAQEAQAFGELCVSPESAALRSIYFATQSLKKDRGVDDDSIRAREVTQVGVLGAGLMGAGVAYVSASHAGKSVRLKDRDKASVLAGLNAIEKLVRKDQKRRRLSAQEASRLLHAIHGTTRYTGFERSDVVIEAVFEDLSLKQQVLREVEERTGEHAIFASNTSSIPISEIAAAAKRPAQVIGMHYFSPVEKMPLLEIIQTPQTAPWVTATCVALGKAQRKTVIVVNDGPGFYTTRILAPLMSEAAHLVAQGAPIEEVDQAMLDFGFPVGPIKLTDEVGIDVGAKVGGVLRAAFGARFEGPEGFERLAEEGRKGRKNKRGFYLYEGKHKGNVDRSVYSLLGITPKPLSISAQEIGWRCTLQMINEAARCFEEGVLRSARDGDVGAIFGLGFPPFRGGPFRMVDAHGAKEIVRRLDDLRSRFGDRFTPAEILRKLAQDGGSFYGEDAIKPGAR